jgi:hypothetical protein
MAGESDQDGSGDESQADSRQRLRNANKRWSQ